MITGDPSSFALESEVSRFFERPNFLALVFFVIHIAGRSFGVRSADASMLACSNQEVEARIRRRGSHIAPFASEPTGAIADAILQADYAPETEGKTLFGVSAAELRDQLCSNQLIWAPDDDAAFDDWSHVLQFDVGDRVWLVGFKWRVGYNHDPSTRAEVWIDTDSFYRTLAEWHSMFIAQWRAAAKEP